MSSPFNSFVVDLSGSMGEADLDLSTPSPKNFADRLVNLAQTPDTFNLRCMEETFTGLASCGGPMYSQLKSELQKDHVHVSRDGKYLLFPNDVEVEVGDPKPDVSSQFPDLDGIAGSDTSNRTITVNGMDHDQLLDKQVGEMLPECDERIRQRMAHRYPLAAHGEPGDHILESLDLNAKTKLEIDLEHAILLHDPDKFAKAAQSAMSLQNKVDQKEVFRDVSSDFILPINLSQLHKGIDVCPTVGKTGIHVNPDGSMYTAKIAENDSGERVADGDESRSRADNATWSLDRWTSTSENASQVLKRYVDGMIDSIRIEVARSRLGP